MIFNGAVIRPIAVGNAEDHAELVRFIDAHGVKPWIGRRFRFEDTKAAYRA